MADGTVLTQPITMMGMPRLRRTIVIFTAATLAAVMVAVGWVLSANGVDQAVAWSTIAALLVAVIGVGVSLLTLGGGAGTPRTEPFPPSQDAHPRRPGDGQTPPPVHQEGRAGRDQFNIAGDLTVWHGRDQRTGSHD